MSRFGLQMAIEQAQNQFSLIVLCFDWIVPSVRRYIILSKVFASQLNSPLNQINPSKGLERKHKWKFGLLCSTTSVTRYCIKHFSPQYRILILFFSSVGCHYCSENVIKYVTTPLCSASNVLQYLSVTNSWSVYISLLKYHFAFSAIFFKPCCPCCRISTNSRSLHFCYATLVRHFARATLLLARCEGSILFQMSRTCFILKLENTVCSALTAMSKNWGKEEDKT